MASLPGYTLEAFIEDAFAFPRSDGVSCADTVRKYEPVRDYIEFQLLECYDPDTQSWRDFRNSLMDKVNDLLTTP